MRARVCLDMDPGHDPASWMFQRHRSDGLWSSRKHCRHGSTSPFSRRYLMKRLAFAALAASVFAIPAFAANCEQDYRDFFARFSVGPAKQYTGAQLAQVNRAALRGY